MRRVADKTTHTAEAGRHRVTPGTSSIATCPDLPLSAPPRSSRHPHTHTCACSMRGPPRVCGAIPPPPPPCSTWPHPSTGTASQAGGGALRDGALVGCNHAPEGTARRRKGSRAHHKQYGMVLCRAREEAMQACRPVTAPVLHHLRHHQSSFTCCNAGHSGPPGQPAWAGQKAIATRAIAIHTSDSSVLPTQQQTCAGVQHDGLSQGNQPWRRAAMRHQQLGCKASHVPPTPARHWRCTQLTTHSQGYAWWSNTRQRHLPLHTCLGQGEPPNIGCTGGCRLPPTPQAPDRHPPPPPPPTHLPTHSNMHTPKPPSVTFAVVLCADNPEATQRWQPTSIGDPTATVPA
jgi:hypothetical protein